jgi:hypothetical protein
LWSQLLRTSVSWSLPFGTSWNRRQSHKVSKDTFMKCILYKTEETCKYINPSKELSGYCSSCMQQQTVGILKLKFWNGKLFTFFTKKIRSVWHIFPAVHCLSITS